MPLINCKVGLSLGWYRNCILSSAGNNATFTVTDAKLYVTVVTLSAEIILYLYQQTGLLNPCLIVLK